MADLAADIREAARHVRNWELAGRLVDPLIGRLEVASSVVAPAKGAILRRLAANLAAAMGRVATDPEVLRGYLLGAAAELESLDARPATCRGGLTMSLPENLPIASFLAPMSSPPRCGECDRLRAALADRDREVAALRRRLEDAERRVIRERSHAEPKEGHRC